MIESKAILELEDYDKKNSKNYYKDSLKLIRFK